MKPKLKKALKITGISLGSLLGLVVIIVALVCWIVFSSSSLTKVAEKAIDKYSPARAKIDDVDLTLVGSYPFLGFRLNGLVVYDDMEISPYDTLAAVDEFTVTVDFKTLYKESKIILTNLYINGIHANLFTAADGSSNLDVFGTSDEEEEPQKDDEGMDIYADLQKISVKGINASYKDLSSGIDAGINDLDINLKGLLNYDSLDAKANVRLASVNAAIRNDSMNVGAYLNDIRLDAELSKYNEDVAADVTLDLKETQATMDDIQACLNNLKLVLSNVSCHMGSEGLDNLMAGFRIAASDLNYSSESMLTETGAIVMKADKASLAGDNANVSGFTFDSRDISLQLEDSVGTITKAQIAKVLLGLEGALKLDLSDVTTGLTIDVEGTVYDQGGEDPMNVITDQLSLKADATIKGDDIALLTEFNTPSIKIEMDSDLYVPGWSFGFTLPLETNRQITRFNVKEGTNIRIDGQQIAFNANGTLGGKQPVAGRARINTPRDLDINRLISMIPESFQSMLDGIDVHGLVGLDINVKGAVADNGPVLDNATAKISLRNLDASVNDSLKAASGKLSLEATYPSRVAVDRNRQTADVTVKATDLDLSMVDSTTINATLQNLNLSASVAGLDEDVDKMNILVDLNVGELNGDMDTISGMLKNTAVTLNMAPADGTIAMKANIGFDALSAIMGSTLSATLGATSLHALAQYDSTKVEILNQWNPQIKMTLKDGQVDMLASPICLKTLDFDFSLGRFNINDCRAEIDDSDIQLWGDIYNIGEFLDGKGLLTGELSLESDYMNMNRLMALTGDEEEAAEAAETAATDIEVGQDTVSTGPIMIPRGIDLTLYTNLSKVDFNEHTFNNVGGDISIKDGVVILQELGFSSNAAEMQLTAIYRTPNVEDRFMELDFHLLDIEIDELIDIVPAVDSIVPMLKALSGKAQFHLSAQTFLEPDYVTYGPLYPQMFTLIGNAVIEGANLQVLDNEVFDGIKRKLLMSKDASPVIDSLDIELQVLDGKVDLYPARIKMDRYEAIISGRHNIDAGLSCNYNISLTKCPLPIRLGVTLSGPLNDIAEFPIRHIKVGRAQYDKLYNPAKSGKVEADIMRRKNTIMEAARSNVRPRSSFKHERPAD
ncbi:MAG: AsmA-like C-terminal region-containing protein [Bacteroidaceae bacterium]|nr:AsmA-like C-terminal region-containing protein [Bacteroidaceae bacterium]